MLLPSLNQFQGCLAGVLVGDSLGFPYEHLPRKAKFPNTFEFIQHDLERIKVGQMIPYDMLESVPKPVPPPDSIKAQLLKWMGIRRPSPLPFAPILSYRQYTDDTSMTITLAKFLTEANEPLDYVELAGCCKFCTQYNADWPMHRMYGPGVQYLLAKFEAVEFEDIFQYAAEQYLGQGSLGNGTGMRIAPVALYTISDPGVERLVEITIDTCRLTHTHPQGIFGGIFQAMAVRTALIFGAKQESEKPTAMEFLDVFESEFRSIVTNETISERVSAYLSGQAVYLEKIQTIRKFLQMEPGSWDLKDIREELGNLVIAPKSIPTALFCFLASFQKIPQIDTSSHFQRTITLAYAIGGDADTIGGMAGAICGAYMGLDGIHESFFKICEAYEKVLSVAEDLYKKCSPPESSTEPEFTEGI